MSKDNKTLQIGGLLKRIGNFDPVKFESSFEHRLIFQKTIYLMQTFGLYVGFPYSWYLRGPYSPKLTRIGYDLVNNYDKSRFVRFIKDDNEKKFLTYLEFLGINKSNHKWLETCASIHYLTNMYSTKSKEEIIEQVMNKTGSSQENCASIWDYLKEWNLVKGRE